MAVCRLCWRRALGAGWATGDPPMWPSGASHKCRCATLGSVCVEAVDAAESGLSGRGGVGAGVVGLGPLV